MKRISPLLTTVLILVACEQQAPDEPTMSEQMKKQLNELYERAKAEAETVPDDVMDWAKEDVAKIGDWEYRIVRVGAVGLASLQEELNEMGSERWEVFWVEQHSDGTFTLFMKRPARSYLKTLPLSQLRHLIPGTDENE